MSAAGLDAYFRWCDHWILPLIADLPRDASILELGCGPGDMLAFLKRSGFETVEGIDLSAEQVGIATDRALNARVADVFEVLASSPGRHRAILALDFVEHFSKDELMSLAPAIRDALEPGGVLILQTPNGQGLFSGQVVHGDLTHLTIFTPGSLEQLFRLFDFEDFRFVETGPAPYGLRGRLRAFGWAVVKAGLNLIRRIETGKSQAIWTENMICRCAREPGERGNIGRVDRGSPRRRRDLGGSEDDPGRNRAENQAFSAT